MTEKHRQRWELEVQIMQRLDHENVIAALEVPGPLDVQKHELPLLAMEYCSGGDLRKVHVDLNLFIIGLVMAENSGSSFFLRLVDLVIV